MPKRTKETGLGRGLNALLGSPEIQDQGDGAVSLPISQVEPGLNQPRKRFDPETLAELADSIRIHGIIQPLTVRRLSTGYYQIIAGERRWRAAKDAGLREVPVVIIEADDKKVMEIGLIENLQREDLNPVEEAQGYQTLMEEYGLTQEQVAQQMGKSRPAITNTLRLLALPEDLLELVAQDQLSAGHARALLAAPTPALQRAAAKRVIAERLSVRQTEALIKTLQKEPKKTQRAADDPIALYLGEVEKTLSGQLGRKVTITAKGDKGRIQLEYYNSQDLDSLLTWLQAHGREGDILYE
ncbi:MAG: ParB/RepB/Spo0J family partition protein [Oscillospiraceae bacterium]|nr:ParB/RepB/Spo0J family partition protein [Oscillospiraceae bacterium]MCI9393662.1 ParB/RepB/Spo0J family partition protein [Oscillospiraceae bacterium]MCI9580375.1 ParB/RepB/Spo0J family partition protein [Oscillospiraceae bacterium]